MIRLLIAVFIVIGILNLIGGDNIEVSGFIGDKITEITEKVLHPESVEEINNNHPLELGNFLHK